MTPLWAIAVRCRVSLPAKFGLFAFAAITLVNCSPPAPTARLGVATDGDFLAFKPNSLTVKTGSHVYLTFQHNGMIITQAHDWTLVQPNAMQALIGQIDRLAAALPEGAPAPKLTDPRVVAQTKPINKGQSTTIEFVAPAPGDYPFFCSTPGHGESMNGVLHVTAQ